MTEDEFWEHIRSTRHADPDAHVERLTARLAKLPPEECLDFGYLWDVVSKRAYRRDLWGAAYVINGGCSDDGFDYFCDWLTLQGREVYEAAIADPDTLAEVLDGEEVEHQCHPGADAWFLAAKAEQDDAGYAEFQRAMRFRHPKDLPLPALAPRWNFDDDNEVRKRFPRLAAMYLGGGEDDEGD
jgi:hypothetical protein